MTKHNSEPKTGDSNELSDSATRAIRTGKTFGNIPWWEQTVTDDDLRNFEQVVNARERQLVLAALRSRHWNLPISTLIAMLGWFVTAAFSNDGLLLSTPFLVILAVVLVLMVFLTAYMPWQNAKLEARIKAYEAIERCFPVQPRNTKPPLSRCSRARNRR